VREKGRESWEIARWMNLHIVSPYSKKKLTVKDIAVFPWEKKKVDLKEDEEKVLQLSKRWNKWKRRS
jgi:hypothetical protein